MRVLLLFMFIHQKYLGRLQTTFVDAWPCWHVLPDSDVFCHICTHDTLVSIYVFVLDTWDQSLGSVTECKCVFLCLLGEPVIGHSGQTMLAVVAGSRSELIFIFPAPEYLVSFHCMNNLFILDPSLNTCLQKRGKREEGLRHQRKSSYSKKKNVRHCFCRGQVVENTINLDLFAKPTENHDTTLNSYNRAWKILKNGGLFGKVVFFSLRILFKEDYISSPSKCKFKPPLFTCVTSLWDCLTAW